MQAKRKPGPPEIDGVGYGRLQANRGAGHMLSLLGENAVIELRRVLGDQAMALITRKFYDDTTAQVVADQAAAMRGEKYGRPKVRQRRDRRSYKDYPLPQKQ